MENVSSTLIYVSKVRSTAETQTNKIKELESSIEALTLQRDAAVEECKKDITRLSEEKEAAVAKSTSLEDTVNELRCQIESLRLQIKAKDGNN